jgi:hypothetical protein
MTALIALYRTTDGVDHDSRAKAAKHQARIDAMKEIVDLAAKKYEVEPSLVANILAIIAEDQDRFDRVMGVTRRKKTDDTQDEQQPDPTE